MADIRNNGRIVVGVDGSDPSKRALRWAIRQAGLTGATLDAIKTWEVPLYGGYATMVETGSEIELLTKTSEQVLTEMIAEVADEDPTVVVHSRVVRGHPARVLLDAAKGADLLVLGSRGHGGFVGALLGSVSQYCVHHATCPVAIIRESHK